MASKGNPTGSGLRRQGPATRVSDDATDPEATLAGVEAETLDVDDADLEVVPGPDDRTQMQAPQLPARTTFVFLVLAGPRAGAEFKLEGDEFTLGRATENEISIPDVSVSRRHARLVRNADDTFTVSDLGSGNGTLVNGEKVGEAEVRHGDEISIGDTVLQLVEHGAPAIKKGKRAKSPQAPSGREAGPALATRQDVKKLPPQAAVQSIEPGRRRLYVIIGVFAAFMIMLGVIQKTRAPQDGEPGGTEVVDADAYETARGLAREHRWIDAVAALEEAGLGEANDPGVQRFLEGARAEAVHEKKLQAARAALAQNDFTRAGELAASVPSEADVYDEARKLVADLGTKIDAALAAAKAALAAGDKDRAKALAQKVLDARAGDPGAQAILDEVSKPEKKAGGPRVAAKVEKEPEEAKPAVTVGSSPAVSLYLQGEVGKALRAAEESSDPGSAALLKQLRAFEANYKDGMAKAQAQRAAEAVRPLGAALAIDRDIAKNRVSKPGKEVGKQLANMEYLLGLECKGDDQLGRAAAHYRAALAADPTHELSQKALDKTYDRARELYKEAYIEKGNDPDRAKKLFKVVIATLPAEDEKRVKSQTYLDKLSGAAAGGGE